MILGLIDSHIYSGFNTQMRPKRRSSHGDQTLHVMRDSYYDFTNQELSYEHLDLISIPDQEDIFYHLLDGVDQLISKEVRVICMPIGFAKPTPLLEALVATCEQHDILLVAPSGNKGQGNTTYPGNYPDVICVGAVDKHGGVAAFSGSSFDDRGNCRKPEVLEEGVQVPVNAENEPPQTANGTSLACAKVAGILAAMIESNPLASPEQLKSALYQSCIPGHNSRFGKADAMEALYLIKQTNMGEKRPEPVVGTSFKRPWIDPRLQYQCEEALRTGRNIGALISGSEQLHDNCDGLATISSFKIFKNFDISHVVASPAFYDMLFDHPDLKWASAVDINYFDL